jgi:hypothetical protein
MIRFFPGWTLLTLSFFAMTSCGPKPEGAPCANDNRFLVFIDKSGSSHALQLKEENKAEFERAIEQLGKNLTFGNSVAIRFVHKQTDTKDFFVASMDTLCRLTSTRKLDRKKEEKQNQQRLEDFRTSVRGKLNEALELENVTSSQKGTDLWSMFAGMSSFFERCDPGSLKQVYIVSDLIEYQKGKGRRDFHNKPPKSKTEAEAFAKEDLNIIVQEKAINMESFESLQVFLLVPNTSLEAHTSPEVIYYWKALLQEFGVSLHSIQVGI